MLDGPADNALAGGARGAAIDSVTCGSAATGAITGGTAGAIRSAKTNEPAGSCYNVRTNERVPCLK